MVNYYFFFFWISIVNYYLVGLLLVKKIVESHKKRFNVKNKYHENAMSQNRQLVRLSIC
jgi:hypothetical protein